MKKRIKIQGFLITLAAILLVIFAKYLLPEYHNRVLSFKSDIIGIALFSSGYALRIAARGYKAALNPDGKTLVISGPYSFSRNPMYLGTLLIGLGVIILLLRWWVGIIFLVIYLAIYIPEIKKEEARLSGFFGTSFQDYCRLTPRFFPSIKSLFKARSPAGIGFRFDWVKKELFSLIPLLIFILCVKIIGRVYL